MIRYLLIFVFTIIQFEQGLGYSHLTKGLLSRAAPRTAGHFNFMDTKICETCGNEFKPTYKEGRYKIRFCSKECMSNKVVIKIIGNKYNSLLIVRFDSTKIDNSGAKIKMVLCKCDCGNECIMPASRIKNGYIKSCGCLAKQTYKINCNQTTHGLTGHPLNRVWASMKQRCYDKNSPVYNRYGGRGICICNEWMEDFMNFYAWALNNGWEKGLHVDRDPDNNGNYEPSNCRITTPKNNSNNRRDNIYVLLNGETVALSLACDKLGVKHSVIYGRMQRNGYDFNEAIKPRKKRANV